MAAWDLCVILPVRDTLQMKGKHVLNSGKMWYIPMKLKQFKILIRYFCFFLSIYIYLLLFGITSHIKKLKNNIREKVKICYIWSNAHYYALAWVEQIIFAWMEQQLC